VKYPDTCEHLDRLVREVVRAGAAVREISQGWSEARLVVHFDRVPAGALASISVSAPVRAFQSTATPHYPANQGFYCAACRIGLEFPA
jgi:hypothetical protein